MIKLANNLSALHSFRIKRAEESPLWEGVKAFGSQLVEPFSGAAHYWTGGRIGSDYADDSPWVDTARRVYNALPGPNQLELQYKDPLLDAAAASLGVSGAAAGGAGLVLAAPAVPHAIRFAAAPTRAARYALPTAARAGQVFKTVAGPAVTLTAPKVIGDAISAAAPAVQNINQYEADAIKKLLEAGYSQVDAERIANKMGWGGVLHAGKEYLSSPYHYIYRQGGSNPIDARFASSMGSPKPHNAFTAAREAASVLSSGPIGAVGKTLGYGAINQLESIPGAIQGTVQQAMTQLPTAAYSPNAVQSAQDAVNNSRFYASMRNYYGDDFAPIATHYGLTSTLGPKPSTGNLAINNSSRTNSTLTQ
jgi:hypothetical protein